jgi:hypothetical protein
MTSTMKGKIASLSTSFAKRLPSCLWAWDIVAHLCQIKLYVGTNGLVSGPLPKKRKSCSLSKLLCSKNIQSQSTFALYELCSYDDVVGFNPFSGPASGGYLIHCFPSGPISPPRPPFSQFAHIFPVLILSLGSNNSF